MVLKESENAVPWVTTVYLPQISYHLFHNINSHRNLSQAKLFWIILNLFIFLVIIYYPQHFFFFFLKALSIRARFMWNTWNIFEDPRGLLNQHWNSPTAATFSNHAGTTGLQMGSDLNPSLSESGQTPRATSESFPKSLCQHWCFKEHFKGHFPRGHTRGLSLCSKPPLGMWDVFSRESFFPSETPTASFPWCPESMLAALCSK